MGPLAQYVKCLTADACLAANPGVMISIPARPINSWKLMMKQFLQSSSSLPLIQEGLLSVTGESVLQYNNTLQNFIGN